MSTTHRRLLAALLAAVLLFSGCSGDDSSGSAGSDDDAPADDDTSDDDMAGDAAAGRELYLQSCQSCHGPEAEGVDGVGKSLAASDFIASTPAADLVDFVKTGRPSGDPDNTTGIDMPPKGGNPALSDDDIGDIVAYMKSLN